MGRSYRSRFLGGLGLLVLLGGCGDLPTDGPAGDILSPFVRAVSEAPRAEMDLALAEYNLDPTPERRAAFRKAKAAYIQGLVAQEATTSRPVGLQPVTSQALVEEGWTGGTTEWTFSWSGSLPIPDDNQRGGTVEISVPGHGNILDVDLEIVSLPHSWIQDIRIALFSPAGTESRIFFNNPAAWSVDGLIPDNAPVADLMGGYFDDEATQNVSWWDEGSLPPFTGHYQPFGFYWWGDGVRHPPIMPLSLMDGEDMYGVRSPWALHVEDTAPDDVGTLTAFGLYLTLQGPGLPEAGLNHAYSAIPNGFGFEAGYSWAIQGALPDGLTFKQNTGEISGTPTAEGTWNFTLVGTSGAVTATAPLSITVNPPLVPVDPSPLPGGLVGSAFPEIQLQATGGGGGYVWSSADLPAGMTLSPGGILAGTPTAAGAFTFNARVVSEDGQTAGIQLTLNVAYPPLQVTTSSPLTGAAGVAYNKPLTAMGGGGSYSWAIISGALPSGLTLGGGAISGVPEQLETATFTLQVTSLDGSVATKAMVMEITESNDPLAIATPSLPSGTRGVFYSAELAASGGDQNYAWTVADGSLPDGISLNGSTLSGTPTVAGLSTFTVEVQSGFGTPASRVLSIEVFDPALAIVTSDLPDGPIATMEYPTTQLVATGGDGTTLVWSVATGSALPGGLTLNASGLISGTVATPGTYSFEIQVSSGEGSYAQTVKTGYLLHFLYPALSILTSALPGGGTDAPYRETQLKAEGGDGSFMWSWAPKAGYEITPGLTLSTAGVISGYPTEPGLNRLIITVTSGASPFDQVAQREFFISIAHGDPQTVDDCYNDGYIPFRFETELACVRFVEEGLDARIGEFPDLVIDPFSDPLVWPEDRLSSEIFSATGGDDNPGAYYRWTSYNLPAWLVVASDQTTGTGTVSGTPLIPGDYGFDITVISFLDSIPESAPVNISVPWSPGGEARDCRQDRWAIYGFNTELQCERYVATEMDSRLGEYPALIITTESVPAAQPNEPYSFTFQATGGSDDPGATYSWAAGAGFPTELTFDALTGTMSGTPTTEGDYSFAVSVMSNPLGWTATKDFSFSVESASTWPDPTTADECKKGGWEAFGFTTQGLCVQFVQTGIDSRIGEPIPNKLKSGK